MELCDARSSCKIKPVEIDTSFLNSHVVTPFCISWAEDNKISMVAEGGVFVFELWPTPLSEQQSLTFLKSWIAAPSASPLSKAVVEDKNGAFLWGLNRNQAFETMLDSTLSCALQKSNISVGSPHITQCEFSPLIGGKSYISCLTNSGLLEIHRNNSSKWEPVVNITELWMLHCNTKRSIKDISFDYFKSKMLELKITTMRWFDKPEIMFLTGHESGLIVLWNVITSNNSLELTIKHKFNVDGKPHYLEVVPAPNSRGCIILVGTLSGTVKYLSINLMSGEIKQSFDLWKDKDLLLPSLIKAKYIDNKLLIFSVKHHILLIQSCSVSNSSDLLMTRWEEFPTAIVGLNEYEDDCIICLQNHDTYVLSLKDGGSGHDIKVIDMGIKSKHRNSYHCYGMAMSQNKAIWGLVTSPKVNYDALKEITHLMFYAPEVKAFKTVTSTTSSGLLETILREFRPKRLSNFFDLLELKKLELLTDAGKFKDSYEMDPNLTLPELQLMLWEIRLKLFGSIDPELEVIAGDLEVLIAKKHAEELVADLEKSDTLTFSQKKSLDVCRALLAGESEKEKTSKEVCPVCGSESVFESIKVSSCANQHKFPRCCLSLLPCDKVPYAACRNCDSVALSEFVSGTNNRCTFCDALLELDARIRSMKRLRSSGTKTEAKKNEVVQGPETPPASEAGDKFRLRRNKANARERNRMLGLNKALDRLRSQLPVKSFRPGLSINQKLSKIETLKIACNYIRILTYILKKNEAVDLCYFISSLAAGLSHPTANVIATSMGFRHFSRCYREPRNSDVNI